MPSATKRSVSRNSKRGGNVLVLLAVLLPALMGVIGLAIDAGLMMADRRNAQHVADAAATAAAMDLLQGKTDGDAISTAEGFVQQHNDLSDASVSVSIPPSTGAYAGHSGFVEVDVTHPVSTYFARVLNGGIQQHTFARAVAGYEASTEGAAIVVLDSNPSPLSVSEIPLVLPALPSSLGGLEALGQGQLRVNGAVLVNTTWGGVDEDGDPAGRDSGPPYAVSCTPLLSLSQLAATDIRVVGGVDSPANYQDIDSSQPSPLRANRLPVPDPFASLPVPTTGTDAANVTTASYGGVNVVAIPLIGAPVTLNPGVYDWIQVVSGNVTFSPGVYIVRGVNPLTNIAVNFLGGTVTAQGVMFYITNSITYDAASGAPDATLGQSTPAAPGVTTLAPSVVLQALLPGSTLSGLQDASSPFNGLVIYQARHDRRPVVVAHSGLLGASSFSGTVYAKYGHVILAGNGTYNARFVAGTMRVVTVANTTINPAQLLPPAQDVFLVE